MCGGGGSGGSGTQQYNWNDTLAPYWQWSLSQGQDLTNTPYQQYPGQRIAGMTGDQTTGFDELRNMNYGTDNPLPTINAAMHQTRDTLNGNYLNGAQMDPYGNSANPYSGFGPKFNSVLQAGQQDITNAYNQGTAADTTRMFNLSGAFGGSAHQNAMANNQYALAKQLANYTSGMQNDQYNRSGQMAEADLARNSGAFQNERNRQMGAINQGNEQQNLGFQRANALVGVGDAYRGLNQDYLNQAYSDWTARRNYPQSQLDYFTGLLSRAQGGVAPNVATSQSGYSANPFSQLLGAGALGYGLLR
jgi:hypothetical protein